MRPNPASPSPPLLPRTNIDRRKGQRIIPHRSLIGQIETDEGERLDARVQNLSARGVALVARLPFALGTILKVRLVNASATFSLVVTIRIVHCNAVVTGDHFLGCEFDRPLLPREMGPFLA